MGLIVLRHTRPEAAEGLCYGRLDLALAADFEAEAARLVADLPPVARIVSSPLSRARRLANALGAARGLTVEIDARLTEMDFGAWEGHLWAELPRDELDAWAADLLGARPHGGESVQALADRVADAMEDLYAGPRPTLIVAHAGVAKAALAWSGAAEPWTATLDFGAWVEISPPAPPRSSG